MTRRAPSRSGGAPDRLVRRDLRRLPRYQAIQVPGALPGDAAPSPAVIKLDGNENVYGCSPRVRRALASFDGYHLYPDPEQRELRAAIAGYAGVPPESIVAGAGSDEIIDLLLRLTLEPGDSVVNCVPTFGMYSFSTEVCGGRVIEVTRRSDYRVDVDQVLRAVEPRTKVIFVASPNNPTGTVTDREVVLALAGTSALLVVDEAYHEFCGSTVADLVSKHENIVVLRTFSKWAGLAGLRVGYGIVSPGLWTPLMTIKPPYNVNAAAQAAVLESVKDIEYLMGTVRLLVKERDRMYRMLKAVSYIEPVPSEANFILCHVKGRDADALTRWLRGQGIYVRYFDTPLLKNAIRISAGKPEQTDAVIHALKSWEG